MAGAYPGFISMKHLGVLLQNSPLDGMLVHRRVTPQQYVTSTHLYTWAEERHSGVKFLVYLREQRDRQRLNPQTSRSGVRVVNHLATDISTLFS